MTFQLDTTKALPSAEDFIAHDGSPLRELFAVAVLRALTPKERSGVLNSLSDDGLIMLREVGQ